MPKRSKSSGRVNKKDRVAKSKVHVNARVKASALERKRRQETG